MKIIKIILLFAILLLAGCSKPQNTRVKVDPVESLKRIVENAGGADDLRGRTVWRNVQYDVRKTDSLVSPYLGTIKADVYEYSKKEIEDNKYYDVFKFDITLAYQDDKWVLKEIEHESSTFTSDGKHVVTSTKDRRVAMDDPLWTLTERDLHL
jgi:hypothetical protein